MGFKSKNIFRINGLIFDSEEEYDIFKNIDKNIHNIVKSVNDGSIDLKDFFNYIMNINVKECYYEASEELDGLFKNATQLLCYEGTRFNIDYKVAHCFFDKINVIKYCDSDSDSDSDSGCE